jgi:DNA-binding NarL/FixJ family response regulator
MSSAAILIIAGESETLDVLIGALSQGCHDVYLVQSHARAIQAIEDTSPQLVLVDALPSVPRMELCHSIAALVDTRETSIIVMLEPGDSRVEQPAGDRDAFDYIEKPIRIAEVLALIRAHIELRRLSSELRTRDLHLHEEAERRLRVEKELDELIAVVHSCPPGALSLPAQTNAQPVPDHERGRRDRSGPMSKLSRREYEVLQFLIQGLSSVDIGRLLDLSDATVRTYRSRIMHKLEVSSFAELIKMSIQWGIA